MPAGRIAARRDALRVDVVFLGVQPYPAHRRLGVMDRLWEAVARHHAVADCRRDITPFRKYSPIPGELMACTGNPAAAVKEKDGGAEDGVRRTVLRGRQVEGE